MINKSFIFDNLLLLYNRPIQYSILRVTSLFGKVTFIPYQGYFVNDLKLSKKILKDKKHFSILGKGAIGNLTSIVLGDIPALFNMEGKKHRELRYKLMSIFNQKYVSKLSHEILKPFIEEKAELLENGKSIDVVEMVHVTSNLMISNMLGLKYDKDNDRELMIEISKLTSELTAFFAVGKVQLDKSEQAKAKTLYDELWSMLSGHYDQADPNQESVINQLKKQNVPEDVALGLMIVLMVAGTETISSGLVRGIALLCDSNEWDLLLEEISLLDNAIDEIMRYVSPSPLILHSVVKDCEIEGINFKANNRVIICQYNILHKSKYNKSPNVFDIRRDQSKDTKYFWFGSGSHYCIGAALAMEEMRIVLGTLASRGKGLKIHQRKFETNLAFPTYKKLLIKYT